MSLEHRSTRCIPALTPPLDDPESTERINMKMHEASICTGLTDVNDDNEDTSACAEFRTEMVGMIKMREYTRRQGKQKPHRRIKTNQKSTESTRAPPQIETMVAKQITSTTKQLIAKEIPKLVVDALDGNFQWAYEKARTGVCSVVYNVVGQFFLACCGGSDRQNSRQTHREKIRYQRYIR